MTRREYMLLTGGAALSLTLSGVETAFAQDEPKKPEWFPRGAAPVRSDGFPYGMGAVPTEKEVFSRSAQFRVKPKARGVRPPRVLLTEFLPPVGDQGAQGSCVGWSTGYYCYSYTVARQRKLTPEQRKDPKFLFSPAFIYNQNNEGKDQGMPISKAFAFIKDNGCATLAEMPYDQKNFTIPPSDEAMIRANAYKARETGYLFAFGEADPEKLKTFLAEVQTPFVMAIPIFKDFPQGPVAPDFVYDLTVEPIKENFNGSHAITIVGYDDDRKAFRMVNSWSTKWGDKGFLYLHENFVKTFGMEGWSEVPGGIISRDARDKKRDDAGAPASPASPDSALKVTESVSLIPAPDR